MIIFVLAIVVVICLSVTVSLYRNHWENGLKASVSFVEKEIQEGEMFTIKEVIENNKRLPLPTLVIKFMMDRNLQCTDKNQTSRTDKQYRTDTMCIMSHERITKMIEGVGTKRGYYSIDEIHYVTTDLLYRHVYTKSEPNKALLYVYPARSKCVKLPEIISHMNGEFFEERMLWEDSMDFRGVRDYSPTDPMRKINWKASAKTGELKVNQYHDSTNRRLTIFLKVSQKGILRYYDLIEESIRICRNFIEEFVSKGISVRIISNGVDMKTKQEIYIREGAGANHVEACLKQLSRMDIYSATRDMQEIIAEQQATTNEVTLLISAEQTDALAHAYMKYGKETALSTWLVPIHRGDKKAAEQRMSWVPIRTNYLVMEELEV